MFIPLRRHVAAGNPAGVDPGRGATAEVQRRFGLVLSLAALSCTLLAAGCGGGGSSFSPAGPPPGGAPGNVPPGPRAPGSANPVALQFRGHDLGTPNARDNRNYRTAEYLVNWGLDDIGAEEAYRRGYFGAGVRLAVADHGFDLTHPDLADRAVSPVHLRNADNRVSESDENVHGTYVAMIAAGTRGNSLGPFEVTYRQSNGSPGRKATKNMHGVAPDASIMPIQTSDSGRPEDAVAYAARNDARVVNLSIGIGRDYFGTYKGRPGVWLTPPKPWFRPAMERDGALLSEFEWLAGALAGKDIVAVWAGGNDGWNAEANEISLCGKNDRSEDGCRMGELRISMTEFAENFSWRMDNGDLVPFKELWGTDCGAANCVDYNDPGGWKLAPLFEPELLGKWLTVSATLPDGRIAPWSNGCGVARNWCLTAPGGDFRILADGSGMGGTSFAAPMVSGSLAVLKSRLPSMPMDVVQAVLLWSATPVGEREKNLRVPDPVYGWGRLNLAGAIAMQGTVSLPFSTVTTTRSVPLSRMRATMSSAFTHAVPRLQRVQTAVAGVGDAYYNMALSDIVRAEAEDRPPLGYLARDMLEPANGYRLSTMGPSAEIDPNTGALEGAGLSIPAGAFGLLQLRYDVRGGSERSAPDTVAAPFFDRSGGTLTAQMQGEGVLPFAAFGDSGHETRHAPWSQYGLQWRRTAEGFELAAELSRIDEHRNVWGSDFGSFAKTRTGTWRNRLFLSARLDAKWRGFADYERNSADVSVAGGMLSGISGLRAEGWSAGLRGRDIFADGGVLRLAVRQKTRVRGGQARIDRVVATGAGFADAFYRGEPQVLERQPATVRLSAPATRNYSLGYAMPLGENAALAFGLEYEDESDDRAISTHMRMEF